MGLASAPEQHGASAVAAQFEQQRHRVNHADRCPAVTYWRARGVCQFPEARSQIALNNGTTKGPLGSAKNWSTATPGQATSPAFSTANTSSVPFNELTSAHVV